MDFGSSDKNSETKVTRHNKHRIVLRLKIKEKNIEDMSII